jgi:thioredoxin reductase
MSGGATDVAIIGAGPYGVSLAAHLGAKGIDVRIFGQPMSFWLAMPDTIHLKSFAFATNVFVPRKGFTFPEYCRAHGLEDVEPCTMASFAAYGLSVQRELVPGVEAVDVTAVREGGGLFDLELQGGEHLRARRVVVATGLSNLAYLPPVLARLPRELVTHSSHHREYSAFAGKDVAVVGGGASALETATMLLEAGARPLLLVRAPAIEFHTKFDPRRSLRERFRAPNSVLGPGRKSWVLDRFPSLLHYVPEARRVRFTLGYLGPSGPWWLHDRFTGRVPHRLDSEVTSAVAKGDKVTLHVSEKKGPSRSLEFDHVIAGTGFEVDVDRIPFLEHLGSRIRRVVRAPALSRSFESSVPGLYFAGAASALSFGPLFRFVAGGAYTSPTIAMHIARKLPRGASRAA